MVMETMQIRLNPGLIKRIDSLVNAGIYSSRSAVIRDAVRRFVWEKEVGSVTSRGEATKIVREAREKLSEDQQ